MLAAWRDVALAWKSLEATKERGERAKHGHLSLPPGMQPEKSAGRYTTQEAHQHLKFFSLAFSKPQTLLKTPQELNLLAVLSVSSELGSFIFVPINTNCGQGGLSLKTGPKRNVCADLFQVLLGTGRSDSYHPHLAQAPGRQLQGKATGHTHCVDSLSTGESSISSCHQLLFCSVMEQAKRTQGKIITTFLQKKSSKSFLVNCMHRKSFVWALIFIKTIPLPMSIKGHYRLHDISGL